MEHVNSTSGLAAMRAVVGCQWVVKFARVLALLGMIIIVLLSDEYRPLSRENYLIGGAIILGAIGLMGLARSVHLRWYQSYRVYDCEQGSKLGVGLFIGGVILGMIVISGLLTMLSALATEQQVAATLEELAPRTSIGAGVTLVFAPPELPQIAALRSEIAVMMIQTWFMACASFAIAHVASGALEITLIELPLSRHLKLKVLEDHGYYVAGLEDDYFQ